MQLKTWKAFLTILSLIAFATVSLAQEETVGEGPTPATPMGALDTALVEGIVVRPAPLPEPVIINQTVETATRVETAIKDTSVAIGVITQDEISRLAPLF